MAVIVVRSDTVLERAVVGVRRVDAPDPARPSDRFQLGSNTKALTATVLASLVAEGRLTWGSTVAAVFPELADSLAPAYRTVTLEQLLTHRAGLPGFTDTDDPEFRRLPPLVGPATAQRRAFTAWVLRHPPAATPGGRGLYSNAGYVVAGAMAERVTGESWEALVRSRVFAPLGLVGGFAWSDAAVTDSAAGDQPWGHLTRRSGLSPVDPRNPRERLPAAMGPAGSVELSADDYGRLLQAELRGLAGRETPLLPAVFVRRLHTPPAAGERLAMGWGLQPTRSGDTASVHAGSAGAYFALTMVRPRRDVAIAVMINAGGDRAERAAREALRILSGRYPQPAVQAGATQARP